jgi:hypothetical protein
MSRPALLTSVAATVKLGRLILCRRFTSPNMTASLAPHAPQEQDLAARFLAAIPARVNADPHLVWRGRTLTVHCLVEIGSTPFLLTIESGRVRECRGQFAPLTAWDFAVRGSLQAWARLWQHPPPPGWHDLFALSKRGEMRFEGNLQPFMAHLQYFKDVLSLPREGNA